MKRKSASQVLHEVDPELNVIPGGTYRNDRRNKAVKLDELPKLELPHYQPHHSNNDDWNDAGGEICPICGKEAVRLVPYGFTRERKACPECIESRKRMLEIKAQVLGVRKTVPPRSGATRDRLRLIKYYAKRAKMP